MKQKYNNKITGNFGTMFNENMQPIDSPIAHKWKKEQNLDRAIQIQKNPYSDPTQISKGVTQTTAGGSFTLYDSTGGTAIFTYNPDTGVVTINGQLVANIINTGTYSNINITGNSHLLGTLSGGVIGTPSLIGGTLSSNVGGTLNGTLIYIPQSGTSALGSTMFDFQLKSGTPVLAYGFGGTTFYWQPTGIL